MRLVRRIRSAAVAIVERRRKSIGYPPRDGIGTLDIPLVNCRSSPSLLSTGHVGPIPWLLPLRPLDEVLEARAGGKLPSIVHRPLVATGLHGGRHGDLVGGLVRAGAEAVGDAVRLAVLDHERASERRIRIAILLSPRATISSESTGKERWSAVAHDAVIDEGDRRSVCKVGPKIQYRSLSDWRRYSIIA